MNKGFWGWGWGWGSLLPENLGVGFVPINFDC